jgi:hypothetical protein
MHTGAAGAHVARSMLTSISSLHDAGDKESACLDIPDYASGIGRHWPHADHVEEAMLTVLLRFAR